MSDTKVSGVVHLIEDTKEYGKNGFRKRLVVLEQENGSFTNYIPVDFIKDSCDTVDEMNVGDEVEVSYRLSGRRWQRDESSEAKYFLNAEAMSVQDLEFIGRNDDRASHRRQRCFRRSGRRRSTLLVIP